MTPEGETIQAGRTGTPYDVPAHLAAELARPSTEAGRLQRAVLALYLEHRDSDSLPTGGRFLWYELVARSIVDKTKARGHPGVTGRGVDQNVSEALLRLRQLRLVDWSDIIDETRDLADYTGWPTIGEGVRNAVDRMRLDPWGGCPPLILSESRQAAGVLAPIVSEYRALISGLGGQVHGHLVTSVIPYLRDGQVILYLGDADLAGNQIEDNVVRVLGQHNRATDVGLRRVALLSEHVERYDLEPIVKRDLRYSDGRPHEAVELEALGQQRLSGMVRAELEAMLPEPLEDVQVRERSQREAVARLLDDSDERGEQ